MSKSKNSPNTRPRLRGSRIARRGCGRTAGTTKPPVGDKIEPEPRGRGGRIGSPRGEMNAEGGNATPGGKGSIPGKTLWRHPAPGRGRRGIPLEPRQGWENVGPKGGNVFSGQGGEGVPFSPVSLPFGGKKNPPGPLGASGGCGSEGMWRGGVYFFGLLSSPMPRSSFAQSRSLNFWIFPEAVWGK